MRLPNIVVIVLRCARASSSRSMKQKWSATSHPSAANASRARVSAFSLASSPWRAASHSCAETIGGVCVPATGATTVKPSIATATTATALTSLRTMLPMVLLPLSLTLSVWSRDITGTCRE